MKEFIEIKPISAPQAHTVRHPVLRPNRPFSSCIFEEDNHPKAIHLGAFDQNQLVGVLSAFPNPCPNIENQKGIQFRAMAVLENYRNKGIGSQLLEQLEKQLSHQMEWDYFWLNARIHAISLYLRVGMLPLGAPFDIPKIGLHQRVFKHL